MRVIGAGLPRTGTSSLRDMLAQLLGVPCYHMSLLYERADEDGAAWMAAFGGDLSVLEAVFDGCGAAVDWPASVLWRELMEEFPDALVVLSHRGSSERWWASADSTVWEVMRRVRDGETPEMVPGIHQLMRERAGFDHAMEGEAARARYDEHLKEVVAAVPAHRLVMWQPEDGWEPLCVRLGVPIPDEETIHVNNSAQFRARMLGPSEE